MNCVSRNTACFFLMLLGVAPAALANPITIAKTDASMAALTDSAPFAIPASGESVMPVAPSGSTVMADTAGSIPMPTPAPETAVVLTGTPAPTAAPVKKEDENGIPASVNDVVDDLRQSEGNVSLEDMARAQDALTRLGLLLDIEKRISDIKKERENREDSGMKSARMPSFNPLPSAALGIPNLASMGMVDVPSSPIINAAMPAPVPMALDYKVEQISGVNGRLRAVIKTGGSSSKTVEQGDKLGRYTVQKINASGVTLVNGKETKILSVESNGAPVLIRPR